MNNKGFAITGIIYTLFVMFLMILLSVLSGLSSLQRLMINSNESLENTFKGNQVSSTQIENMKLNGEANCFGKYIFEVIGPDNKKITCSTYLNKGTKFQDENIIYSPSNCNEYEIEMELVEAYSFEEGN